MSGLPAQDGVRQFHHQLPPRPREQRSSESFRMKFKCESCRDAKRRCVRLNIEYKCDRCDKKDLPCSVPMLPNGTIHDFNTPIDFESNVVQETAGNPPGSSHDFALLPAVFDGTMHTAPFEPMQNNILEAIEEPRAPTDMPHSYHLIGPSPGDHEERYFVKLEKSIAPSLTSSDSSYRRFKMSGLLENPTYITFDLRNMLFSNSENHTSLLERRGVKYIYVWHCCSSNHSATHIMVDACLSCGRSICVWCQTRKIEAQ